MSASSDRRKPRHATKPPITRTMMAAAQSDLRRRDEAHIIRAMIADARRSLTSLARWPGLVFLGLLALFGLGAVAAGPQSTSSVERSEPPAPETPRRALV